MKCGRCGKDFEPQEFKKIFFDDFKVFHQISYGRADDRSWFMLPVTKKLCPACNKSFERWMAKGSKKK